VRLRISLKLDVQRANDHGSKPLGLRRQRIRNPLIFAVGNQRLLGQRLLELDWIAHEAVTGQLLTIVTTVRLA
jgi:hypothetical protein